MMVNINNIGLALALALSLHPVIHIIIDKKYRCTNGKSLYLSRTYWSRLATNPWTITFSAGLAFFGLLKNSFFYLIPLLLLVWKLFIKDRFVSLARGQGAPGYFCFLNTVTICLVLLNNESAFIKNLSAPFQAVILVEYGAIFLSAGAFKFVDFINGNSMAFALGLINPMWSKIFGSREFINRVSHFINFLGPSLQVIGGLLVLTGIRVLMTIGYIIIGAMFILITPQTRLGWLCPSIASGAYINYTLIMSYNDNASAKIFFILAVFVRMCVLRDLFREYFSKSNSNKLMHITTILYRRSLGVIIWKVFTFDIVRYICSRQSRIGSFDSIYIDSAKTNVYDSITLVSLISSRKYISESDWEYRIQRALSAFDLELLQWINIRDNRNEPIGESGSFFNSKIYSYEIERVYKSDKSDYNECLGACSLQPYSSYAKGIT